MVQALTSIIVLITVVLELGAAAGVAGPSPPPSHRRGTTVRVPPLADSLLVSFRPKLRGWVRVWRQAIPGFGLERLRLAGSDTLVLNRGVPLDSSGYVTANRMRFIYRYSPDSAYAVDPNYYMDITGEEGRIIPGYDADAGVALIDLKLKTWMDLIRCGTTERWDEAYWRDNRTFAVVGFADLGDTTRRIVPTLTVYNLARHRVTFFLGPEIAEEQMSRYENANDADFVRRHPGAKPEK